MTVTPKTRYEDFKRDILAAGRFSVFEVDSKNAKFYTRLGKDPELDCAPMQYPWVGVKKK